MIGNGNDLGWLWYNAGEDGTPDLHIRDLRCGRGLFGGHRCDFRLVRDGGVKTYLGEQAPDRLNCRAVFGPDPDDPSAWKVKHYPPAPEGGHSRTSMTCKVAPST
jgi:hypothetical protein